MSDGIPLNKIIRDLDEKIRRELNEYKYLGRGESVVHQVADAPENLEERLYPGEVKMEGDKIIIDIASTDKSGKVTYTPDEIVSILRGDTKGVAGEKSIETHGVTYEVTGIEGRQDGDFTPLVNSLTAAMKSTGMTRIPEAMFNTVKMEFVKTGEIKNENNKLQKITGVLSAASIKQLVKAISGPQTSPKGKTPFTRQEMGTDQSIMPKETTTRSGQKVMTTPVKQSQRPEHLRVQGVR